MKTKTIEVKHNGESYTVVVDTEAIPLHKELCLFDERFIDEYLDHVKYSPSVYKIICCTPPIEGIDDMREGKMREDVEKKRIEEIAGSDYPEHFSSMPYPQFDAFKAGVEIGYKANTSGGKWSDEDIRYAVQHIKNLMCLKSIDDVSEQEVIDHLNSLSQSEYVVELDERLTLVDTTVEEAVVNPNFMQPKITIENGRRIVEGKWVKK